MAITISVLEVANDIGIGDGVTPLPAPIAGKVGRCFGAASAMVLEYLPDTPTSYHDYLHNEAAIRAAGYLYDNDGSRNRRFSDVLAMSGALSVLRGSRVLRATALDGMMEALARPAGGGNEMFLLTAIPTADLGEEGDTALVRYSAIELRAYEKSGGTWRRLFSFHGGDTVFLAELGTVADRTPAAEPTSTVFLRRIGISGYAPVTEADIDQANPSGGTVGDVADLRGGNHGTANGSRSNTIGAPSLTFTYSVPVYVWFGLEKQNAQGLSISAVTQAGADIPIVAQDDLNLRGDDYVIYRTVNTYTQPQVDSADYELTIEKDPAFPNTWNRYAVVTANPVPTEADFLSDVATVSQSTRIFIPNSGWTDGQGYLHFALPASQAAPTIAGLAGGTNLVADFAVRSVDAGITINGDDMRTLSSESPAFQMTDAFDLFPWIVR